MVPFIAEHTWQVLVRPADSSVVASVHLTDFPVAASSLINAALNEQVAMTRRVVELGRSARAESAIKIRQPLQRALISAQGWASLPEDMKAQISDELNVIELEDIANADGDLVDISVKANFKSLGAKYGKAVQDVAKLVAAADATALVKGLRSTGSATLGEFAIDIDDLVVTEVPKSGWMVASHDGESVALDLALSPELIASGNVREVIRLIQERRKSDGFDISDRISVRWSAPADLADVIAAHAWRTYWVTMAGFGIAIVVGVLLGFVIGSSRLAYAAVYPLMTAFNALPKAAFVPILVVWFGIGIGPAILTAFLISFFPIMVNIATGLATLEPELEDVLRVLGAKRWDVLVKVGLPRSMPYFYGSLKVAITLAFVGTTVSEMTAANEGIGYLLISAGSAMQMGLAFSGLMVVGAMAMAMYELFSYIEKHTTAWAHRSTNNE
jgi:ABC-type nitrate/sulfonate/bicarbonate transport system permease component